MTKLNVNVHYSETSGKYWLNIWTGDKVWFLADNKDRLHYSSSYSTTRITKRRIKQEKKWHDRLAARDAATVNYHREV